MNEKRVIRGPRSNLSVPYEFEACSDEELKRLKNTVLGQFLRWRIMVTLSARRWERERYGCTLEELDTEGET